jgi:chemotaxis protein CheX
MSTVAASTGNIRMSDLESSLEKAVSEVFSTMLNLQPIIVPCTNSAVLPLGVSAIVGFGGKLSGFLALHMSPADACFLASGMLGMGFSELDEIVSDAMGEIVNMLAGGLKKYASQTEELFKISIPSVISGNDYSTHAPKDSEQRVLQIQAGHCSIAVQLVVEHV